jgi:isoquinoline 1-oxidoreductase beta subunit
MTASRRDFIKGTTAAALVIGFRLPDADAAGDFTPNAFVRIGQDNSVTVISKHLEMGQGIHTGLATLVAEELDADWSQIRVEAAPADVTRYNNLLWGQVQGTGNSSSIANAAGQMRQAGAIARAMLVQAAAIEWNIPAGEIIVAKGVVSHEPSKRRTNFGALAAKAATLIVPWTVRLKQPDAFILIGTDVARVDTPAKIMGSALYSFDVKRPGMLTALVARPPRFGGKMKVFDAAATKSVPGIVDAVEVPTGVAVIGHDFWSAKKGRDALKVEWDETVAEKRGSAELLAEYRELLSKPGLSVRKDGEAESAVTSAARSFTADYEFPYLAHAPMEPLNCTVELTADRCEIWSGSQVQTADQVAAAVILGFRPEQILIHTMLAGGSFGRRGTFNADLVAEAVSIAKAIGGRAPVHLVRTREDDIQGGYYRPLFVHRLRAGMDSEGRIVGWHHRIVGQPLAGEALGNNSVDPSTVQGAVTLPYAIPNLTVETHATKAGIPVLWWRSVGSSHNGYSTETFIDELAAASGKDPIEFRLGLLVQQPRPAAVLKLAAEKAGWDHHLARGRFRGIAMHEWVGTHVAQVAEISLNGDAVKVERVICVVDCGTAINPDIVKAQMESGISYGLGAALRNAITLTEGRVDQSNFHDYQPLRLADMPDVEVHIVPSTAPPSGVGEAAVPPIAPAVANAIFAATGMRLRVLPFDGQKLRRT